MTARRRVLWISSLAPWVVAALVWGVVQLAGSQGGPGTDGSATDGRALAPVERPVERPDEGAAPARHATAKVPDWPAILTRLDRQRERAYAADDPTRLRSVYVAGSTVLRHDLAMLRAYRERGVRLTGVRLRLLDVAMLGRTGPYARLRIVDRLDRPTARTSKGTLRLPQDQPTDRLVVLREAADGWRIAAVRPA